MANADGSITYTASAGFSGTDVLQYTIRDDNGGVSLPAHFFIRVNRPTAADEWTDTDGRPTPVSVNVLADAADPDGNQHLVASSMAIVTCSPAHRRTVVSADGTITYTANGNFSGTDVSSTRSATTTAASACPPRPTSASTVRRRATWSLRPTARFP